MILTKKFLARIIILLLLFLAGCTILPITPKNNINIQETRTGTQGITSSFIDSAPPSEVFENQLFEVSLMLENKGAADVQNGVYVFGIPDDLETRDDVYGRFGLKGKTFFNPFGDSKLLSLKVRAREIAPQLERITTQFGVDLCYPYRTEVGTGICINPVGGVQKQVKVCTPSSQGFAGQGGPVAVTSIEAPQILPHENSALVKPQIILHIKNVGGGIVVSKSSFADACAQRGAKGIYNIINIGGSLSDIPLNCAPSQLVLSEKDNAVICTLSAGLEKTRGSHVAQLKIVLDYGYYSKKTKPLTIKKAFE